MMMPVISMYPPWANWVGLGWKTIETRTHQRFRCLLGRRIGIHVSVKWDKMALATAGPWLTQERYRLTEDFLHVGGAICWTAHVRDYRALNSCDSLAALIDCSPNSPQRYGLFLSDVQMIEAIPAKGKQGIWYHDIPVEAQEGSNG